MFIRVFICRRGKPATEPVNEGERTGLSDILLEVMSTLGLGLSNNKLFEKVTRPVECLLVCIFCSVELIFCFFSSIEEWRV